MPLYHFIQEGSNIKATCHTSPYSVSLHFAPTAVSALCGNVPDRRVGNQLKSSSLAPSMIGVLMKLNNHQIKFMNSEKIFFHIGSITEKSLRHSLLGIKKLFGLPHHTMKPMFSTSFIAKLGSELIFIILVRKNIIISI